MEKQIIGRGVLAGLIAGVFAFVFARIFVEPVIDRAIAFEDSLAEAEHAAEGHDHEVEVVSRTVQQNLGMGIGVLAFSIAMGALFAVAFAVLYRRTTLTARSLAVVLALGAFVTVYLVPFLKYPANPPAVSLDGTIQQRTGLYLLLTALSVALGLAAVWLWGRLSERLGAWNATLAAAGAYIVAVAVVMLVLPTIDETPSGFAADDLYEFRLYALGTQVVIWATIGLVFAALVGRLTADAPRRRVDQLA